MVIQSVCYEYPIMAFWIRDLHDDPRAKALSLAAIGMYGAAGAYCSRHKSEGRFRFGLFLEEIKAIGLGDENLTRELVDELVRAGFLSDCGEEAFSFCDLGLHSFEECPQ